MAPEKGLDISFLLIRYWNIKEYPAPISLEVTLGIEPTRARFP
jgi:hypothetical protein